MIKSFAIAASLLVFTACDRAPAFYRVEPDTRTLTAPTRNDRASVAPTRPYARLEFMALPTARSFLDQGIVTMKVVSGTVELTRAFAAARALAPESNERWFATIAVPLSDTGVVKVWVHVSIVNGASADKMVRIAEASQDFFSMIPLAAQLATTAKGAVELAAAMSGARVDRSYVQTFDLSFGPGCAEATTTCLTTRGDDTFVIAWGLSSADEAATLKLDAGVLRSREGGVAKYPALTVKVTTPSFPPEIFSPEARASLESAAPRDGGVIQDAQLRQELVYPLHRPALRAFERSINAARAIGISEDATAVAVANLDDWVKSTCGPELMPDTLPCVAAARVVARHRSATPALTRLATVVKHWQAASAQIAAERARDRDPCVALDSTRPSYTAAAAEADQLLADHPELVPTTPGLSALRREATNGMRDLADSCFAARLRAAARGDADVEPVLGSITATDVKRGSFYIPNRAAVGTPALQRIRTAVGAARASVGKLAPAQLDLPTIDWFVTLTETQCADATAVSKMLEKRGDAIVAIISSYLDDAIEAAKAHECEQDVATLVRAAKELEAVPSDKDAVADLAKKLKATRDALLAAVRKSDELRRLSHQGPSCDGTTTDPAAPKPNAPSPHENVTVPRQQPTEEPVSRSTKLEPTGPATAARAERP